VARRSPGANPNEVLEFQSLLASVLDMLVVGLLIADGNLQVRWLNRAANDLLVAGAPIEVGADGRLSAKNQVGQNILRDAMVATLGPCESPDRPIRSYGYPRPVTDDSGTSGSFFCTRLPSIEPLSLMLMAPHPSSPSLAVDTLARLYRLTRAEADIATSMLAGSTLDEIAEHRHISWHTARTHFKNVLAKARVSGRSGLTRAVLSGPAALARLIRAEPALREDPPCGGRENRRVDPAAG
jgi:DNA-binding CsgD family transcriptional regulator